MIPTSSWCEQALSNQWGWSQQDFVCVRVNKVYKCHNHHSYFQTYDLQRVCLHTHTQSPYRCARLHIQISAGFDYEHVITYGLHYWEQHFIWFSKDHQEYAGNDSKNNTSLCSHHKPQGGSHITDTEINCPVQSSLHLSFFLMSCLLFLPQMDWGLPSTPPMNILFPNDQIFTQLCSN